MSMRLLLPCMLLLSAAIAPHVHECSHVEFHGCLCFMEDDRYYDILSLGDPYGTPAFRLKLPEFTVFYNPCFPIQMLRFGAEEEVAIFKNNHRLSASAIAFHKTTWVRIAGDMPSITYEALEPQMWVTIRLICDHMKTSFVCDECEPEGTQWFFNLTAREACWKRSLTPRPKPTTTTTTTTTFRPITTAPAYKVAASRLSLGSILLIMTAVFAFLYLAVGFLINRHRHNLTGASAVPHAPFWSEVGDNIRLGFAFLCGQRPRPFGPLLHSHTTPTPTM